MSEFRLTIATVAVVALLGYAVDAWPQGAPLVPPPAVEEQYVPLVYCHAQGGVVVDGKCVKRERKQ